jgi:hypothetical protein
MAEEQTLDTLHDDTEDTQPTGTGTGSEGADGKEGADGIEPTGSGAGAPSPRAGGEPAPEPTAEDLAATAAATLEAETAAAATTAAAEGGGEPAPTDGAEGSDPPVVASGVEQFLAQFGIADGLITFEAEEGVEGSVAQTKHYNDLTQEEQFNILSDLAEAGAPSAEEKYGLEQSEIGLINFVRENGGTVEEALNKMAQERVDQLRTMETASGVDYDAMGNDSMMARYLKDQDPEASEQEVTEEVARRKEGRFYEKDVESIRGSYKTEALAKANEAENTETLAFEAELEVQRGVIATAVNEVESVAGWKVNNDQKNEVLSDLLETNDDGDSKFMADVFSDPKELFRVAWLAKNAEAYIDELEKHYKRENANEYQRGKEHGINGLPSTPIGSGSSAPSGTAAPEAPAASREEKVTSTSNLWDND